MPQQIKEGEITVIQDKFGSDQTINIEEGSFRLYGVVSEEEHEDLELDLLRSGDIIFRIAYWLKYTAVNEVDGTTYEKFRKRSQSTITVEKWAVKRLAEWLGGHT